ncbi:hypothetical protein RND81_06G125700 [Saponaria officinalis]|uniref:Integrase catalytic domain-containing protein n=1 Tax=Saponaria officinalis TaxID=3572 RepID=A0AAW1KCD7_SAPOF
METTHLLKITTTLTGSENYPLWKRQMELALSAKRKPGYVTGKTVKPKEDEEKIETWTVANNQVITWILQNRYTVANGARKFKLSRESYEIAQNGRSIEEYFTQLQVVWDELENLCTLPTITKVTTEIAEYLTAVEKQAEERRLFQFLNGLDKEYGILRSNILMMDHLPSVDHTVSLVLQEEQQTSNLNGARTQEASALLGNGEHEKDRKSNFRPGTRGGFKQERPYQVNMRPSNYKRNASNVKTDQMDLTAAIGAATQQLESLLKLVPNSSGPGKSGGDSEEELECNFVGMMTQTAKNNSRCDWILDSGASNHMTFDLEHLKNVKELNNRLKINLSDGRYVRVTHRGDVTLNGGLRLKNVLYVPEFKQHLLSIQKLTQDNHYYGCTDGDIKGLGKEISGLYYLTSNNEVTKSVIQGARKSVKSPIDVNESGCAECKAKSFEESVDNTNVAKLTKLPFPTNQTTVNDPFDLIHIDIWGPYKVAYKGKFRYFLTIVYDQSRGTWVYLLSQKSEAFETLTAFYEYVKTQFEKRIKFDDFQCWKFFETNGVVHQTSMVDRPQQNGVVERKHRHLLEISRALRFHSGISLNYWGDCVLAAAHLINRLPSSVNKNLTPYEAIYGNEANYEELKVFWCLAMAYNPDRGRDKFQPRVVPCVFLGYPVNRKGYKVEELIFKRRFVTRDLMFYESIFPYSHGHKHKFMHPISMPIIQEEEDCTNDTLEQQSLLEINRQTMETTTQNEQMEEDNDTEKAHETEAHDQLPDRC